MDSTTKSDYTGSNIGSHVGMIVPTISEDEQQGKRIQGEHLSMLPRSVRWRIQLGLLQDPSAIDLDSTLETVLEYNKETLMECNKVFKELVEKVEETEEVDDSSDNMDGTNDQALSSSSSSTPDTTKSIEVDVDPLTAIVLEKEARETRKAELYLKYRKERARRKRGLTTEARIIESESDEVDRASLIIIEKDLKRLPHPTETKQPITGNSTSQKSTPEHEARITSLREILYIYAQEHPKMGYRQGMHEIASYLLFVLELEHKKYPEHPLFNPMLPICFAMLERTLKLLKSAYDASGSGKSLQQMSISILGKILQNNPPLYHHLTSNPNIPPPPIYCTRWVRLMFSREVVGYENVFKLWDVLFSYANVMQALEITSASRILLLGDLLLIPENNSLDLLMNVDPLQDISILTDTLQELMKQKANDQPIQLPSMRSMAIPTGPTQRFQQNQELSFSRTLQNPHPHALQPQQLQSPLLRGDSKFSFHKMRQSLGQTGESLRKKIITTTVEWKATNQNSAKNPSNNPCQQPLSGFQTGYGDFTNTNTNLATSPPAGVADGVLTLPGTAHTRADAVLNTPKQRQHEMWSQLLQRQIWTVQQFLLDLESKENKGSVPRGVWEALADMDRMQRELLNYSRSSIGGPSY
mmetsp:Transcript_52533/g.58717  ORF Transcript_52533/g.58717 Transcript_52533/m.58717 type:complete len:641 (+) Transcript_52533:101-2023(+)